MSDRNERACSKCGSYLHHEEWCDNVTGNSMSDLRARARIIAMAALGECYPYQFSQDTQHKITDAILRGMVEALEEAANLSPNGCDVSAADMPHTVWKKYSDGLRAMAAARAREIKEGK